MLLWMKFKQYRVEQSVWSQLQLLTTDLNKYSHQHRNNWQNTKCTTGTLHTIPTSQASPRKNLHSNGTKTRLQLWRNFHRRLVIPLFSHIHSSRWWWQHCCNSITNAIQLTKRNHLVNRKVYDMINKVLGLVWVVCHKLVQVRQWWQKLIIVAIVRFNDVQLGRSSVRINTKFIKSLHYFVRVVLNMHIPNNAATGIYVNCLSTPIPQYNHNLIKT
jgi:hypothetical protein